MEKLKKTNEKLDKAMKNREKYTTDAYMKAAIFFLTLFLLVASYFYVHFVLK
jgi:hypothetical protein